MADYYRIMQITETGERFCVEDSLPLEEAEEWLVENRDQYPESKFYLQKIIDDPYAEEEDHDELDFN